MGSCSLLMLKKLSMSSEISEKIDAVVSGLDDGGMVGDLGIGMGVAGTAGRTVGNAGTVETTGAEGGSTSIEAIGTVAGTGKVVATDDGTL